MITVSAQAASQIRTASVQGDAIGMPLRIAVRQKPDGTFHYLMGFDDQQQDGDQTVEAEGVTLVVAADSQPLVNGMTLNFVDLDGKLEFIFLNPNDPSHSLPQA